MGYIGSGPTRFNTADELTVTGDAQIDGTTLVVDSTNNRVGIGTSSPTKKLHLTATDPTTISATNVMLEGGITGYGAGVAFGSRTSAGGTLVEMAKITADGEAAFNTTASTQDAGLRFFTTEDGTLSERMRITSGGNVGIGTSSPSTSHKLTLDHTSNYGGISLKQTGTQVGQIIQEGGTGNVYVDADSAGVGGNLILRTNGGSERMRIDSSGNVGIGTTSPSSKLDITNSYSTDNNTSLTLTNSNGSAGDNGAISYRTYTGSGYVTSAQINSAPGSGFNASYLKFRVADSSQSLQERMRIDTSGNLLVGTTSVISSGKISVQATSTNPAVVAQGTSDCFQGRTTQASGTSYFAYWVYNGSNVGSITSTGSTTSYNTTSDHRLKENVTDITGATERLKQLNPVRFNFIADADATVDGFLAHEVQTVVPEAITGTHNQVEVWTQEQIDAGEAPENTSAGDNKLDDDGNTIPVYQGIDQSKLVPLLVATIQELEARIAALEAN